MDAILKASNTTSIYLQASIPLLVERLRKGKESRPLVKELGEEKLVEYVAKHLFERRFFYEQANQRLVIDNKELDEIITEMNSLLH